MVDGKKLFFARGMKYGKCKRLIKDLLLERTEHSPHKYDYNDFGVEEGSVLLDVGAAEGIFALQNIERLSKVILFECENGWIDALNATFEPWKEKVSIIHKYVSSSNNEHEMTLDLCNDIEIDAPVYLKMDIEGAEESALLGAKHFLTSHNKVRIAVCCYHTHDAEAVLSDILHSYGYKTRTTKGMMYVNMGLLKGSMPYLRRGIIQAQKNDF